LAFCVSRRPERERRKFAAGTGFSEQTFYRWKAKYGGMELSDADRPTDPSLG